MHPSHQERRSLCDLLAELGPDAPTLCEGWNTRDLAAHLWIREHRLDAAPGLLGRGPFAGHTERLQEQTAHRPYEQVVAELRAGPPWFWISRWYPDGDLHEFFVHHEDVRRANGRGRRTDAHELDAALWRLLGRWGRILTRKAEVGVALATPDGQRRVVHTGEGEVVLNGHPSELMLRLFGRDAEVELEGSDDDLAAFERSTIGP